MNLKLNNPIEVLKVFKDAKVLIENPKNWTISWHARTIDGLAINAKSYEAEKFAITGALFRALYNNSYEENSPIYEESVKALFSGISKYDPDIRFDKIIDWNDRATHAEVLRVLDKCIDKISKQIK